MIVVVIFLFLVRCLIGCLEAVVFSACLCVGWLLCFWDWLSSLFFVI